MALIRKLAPPKKALQAPVSKKPLGKPAGKVAPRAPAHDDTSDGSDGFAIGRRINAERQREMEIRKNRPLDFRMKVGEGDTKGVVVVLLDKPRKVSDLHFQYRHYWGFESNDSKDDICIKDDPQGCPRCKELGKTGTYELNLSCVDTRPYVPKSGPNAGKTVRRSKKLFTVKTSMQPKFERLFKEHGTFRGMTVRMFRDNKKDAAIGSDVKFVKMLSEAELKKEFGEELSTPVDYKKAFPRPTYEEYAKRLGMGDGSDVPGSDDFGKVDDDIPF